MTKSIRLIALQIAQLLEENTEKELQEAVKLLHEHGYNSTFLSYLAAKRNIAPRSKQAGSEPPRTKAIHEATSRAVLKLRDEDPDKFRVLSEFDLMVRRGQLLATHEHLRRFGEHISKNFEPRKARKDTIGALMAVLADRQLNEIEHLVEFAASLGVAGNTDEYQRLAQFLINGKKST